MNVSHGWIRLTGSAGRLARPTAGLLGSLLVLSIGCSAGSVGGPSVGGTGGGGVNGTGGAGGQSVGNPGNGTGPIVSLPSPSSRLARLNNKQWENTLQTLLRLPQPLGLSSGFVTESLETSFDTNGSLLSIATNQWAGYKRAAVKVANQVSRDATLLAVVAPTAATPAARAEGFIRDFGLRAFRRPLTAVESQRYLDLFNKGATLLATGDAFADGVEMVLRALFQSPNFLYRIETSDDVVGGKIPLGDYEVATRLAYSLTNSTPDDTLLAAAAARKLQASDAVREQAKRLLESPAGQATVGDYHYQLLHLENDDHISKDIAAAPAFPPEVNAALKQETLTFVKDVIYNQNLGVTELLTAPYTFGNNQVAKIYGVAGSGDAFTRLPLNPAQRAGLLTQAGFLAFYADGQTPSIILRGARIAQDFLCVDIPPPPGNIPPLPDLDPKSTNRKRVEDLTKDAPCSTCHPTFINPIGFAFENLDGFAQYRTMENGQAINAASSYTIDGKPVSFNGPVELIKLIAQSQQGHDCYARHLTEYLYGRGIDVTVPNDQSLVSQAGAHSKVTPSVRELILNLVSTDAFLARAP